MQTFKHLYCTYACTYGENIAYMYTFTYAYACAKTYPPVLAWAILAGTVTDHRHWVHGMHKVARNLAYLGATHKENEKGRHFGFQRSYF